MALFSTLLSASNEQATSTPSSIPTLIQLFHTKSITFDDNAKLESHAVLAYQALEVASPVPEGESKLFGQRRKANQILTPNLGVWNCCISKNELVDSVLTIPDVCGHYSMTVDLSDPSMVEPSLAILHDALVRILIQQPPQDKQEQYTTSLSQLKSTQFGLAPEDKAATSQAPAESDDEVKIALMICVLVGPSTKDDYKETQAQNLVLYHLRRYAAALNCSLCFVGKTDMEVPSIRLDQVTFCWREWILNKLMDELFAPHNHQPDLIEAVLLRNAQYAGEWDVSKDSLWKALPPSANSTEQENDNQERSTGDDDWLSQLRDSVAVDNQTPSTPSTSSQPAATPKTEDAAVSSFFENLLKK